MSRLLSPRGTLTSKSTSVQAWYNNNEKHPFLNVLCLQRPSFHNQEGRVSKCTDCKRLHSASSPREPAPALKAASCRLGVFPNHSSPCPLWSCPAWYGTQPSVLLKSSMGMDVDSLNRSLLHTLYLQKLQGKCFKDKPSWRNLYFNQYLKNLYFINLLVSGLGAKQLSSRWFGRALAGFGLCLGWLSLCGAGRFGCLPIVLLSRGEAFLLNAFLRRIMC